MRFFTLTLLLFVVLGVPRAADAAPVFFDPGKFDKFFDFNHDFFSSFDWDHDHHDKDKGKGKYKWDDDWRRHDDWDYDDGKGCGKYGSKDCKKFDPGHDHGRCDPGDPGLTPTPLPASALLFITALLGLTGFAFRERNRKA